MTDVRSTGWTSSSGCPHGFVETSIEIETVAPQN
jgi:hypothetical protein